VSSAHPPGAPSRHSSKGNADDTKHCRNRLSEPVLGGSLVCFSYGDRARWTVFFQVADGCLPGGEGTIEGDLLRIGVADMGRSVTALRSRSVLPNEIDRIGDRVIRGIYESRPMLKYRAGRPASGYRTDVLVHPE
jgi:hypothetical protein